MGWIIAMIFFTILITASWVGGSYFKRLWKKAGVRDDRSWWVGMGVTTGVLVFATVLLTFFSSFTTVSTKNVGIETSFGATAGELSNGAHFIPPWEGVTEMDAAIQTDSYTSKDCLDIRIANQQTACVHITIRWRIKPHQADALFRNFRTFEHVRDSLVTRDLTAAVNDQFSSYNPLNSVLGGVLPRGQRPNPPLTVIADHVRTEMRRKVGAQIEVLTVIIPIITFDQATQSRINQLQQQIALTRIAEQARVTATAQARANRALSTSVNRSPNVLVSQCYEILNQMVKTRQPVPAGFNCWPGKGVAAVIASAPAPRQVRAKK